MSIIYTAINIIVKKEKNKQTYMRVRKIFVCAKCIIFTPKVYNIEWTRCRHDNFRSGKKRKEN